MKLKDRNCGNCVHFNADPSLGEISCWNLVLIHESGIDREPKVIDRCIQHLSPEEDTFENEYLESCERLAGAYFAAEEAEGMHYARIAIREASWTGV